ncbi:MAG: outer membrane protein assembly factor BamD [Rickettsiaceae bacterium]|nr:outer membrane protein assembly factor BamD [Rickettsiaceae bacterium]
MNMHLILNILVIGVLLTSCSNKKKDSEIIIPSDEAYKAGLELLKKQKFNDAAEKFGDIYFQHPGAPITSFAELMEAYSLFKTKKYLDAIDVIDNFAVIHPTHQDMPYALYLKGLCYYNQILDVYHDQDITKNAKQIFEELISRYPNTTYAKDAKAKLNLVYDHLAGKEMEIGRYYQKRLNPIGAINRFSTVVNDYQTTSHTQEALFRLVESYIALGLTQEAAKYASVLSHNYKDSSWDNYAKKLLGQAGK